MVRTYFSQQNRSSIQVNTNYPPQADMGLPSVTESFNIITNDNDPIVTNAGDNLVHQ